jgi:5-methylcytosine-specific restriction protein B
VQFHQNTSYDDFVIGYKPNVDGGFEVKEGPFVTFCEKAAADAQGRGYYFIIDEINRANISKVFGELLMLIENSHRGESVRLGIDGREFSVPKNVYIIGMMNTADRGLALIDYALRRRFAFYEMIPALSHPKFKERVNKCKDKRLPALVDAVIKLNKTIAQDPSLDEGFCIGHSYFCKEAEFEEGCAESIVKYELVPLIREYWFDDKDKAANEIKNLEAAIRG